MKKSISPCLRFNHNAKKATGFYCSIFNNAKIIEETPTVVTFEINSTKFMGLNGGDKYAINSVISFCVYCGSEAEFSRMYKALTTGNISDLRYLQPF